ncbi:helix-turn-helix domain-containing protein [Dactylosporangium sp. NPDC005555]|uniref:winged helix-turn-helix transcriptional regulator n=1 Tax=Dactylosporangium sp. NPDC005555 TaxID=3154889 RepID=UPI00339E0513
MASRTRGGRTCSVAQALDVVGERWNLLILRDALLGSTRFDAFLNSLGIARNVLANRLNGLVRNGIFVRVPYQHRPLRHEYLLTERGRELTVVIVALMEWGDRHFVDGEPFRVAVHSACGGEVHSRLVCTGCGGPVAPADVTTRRND